MEDKINARFTLVLGIIAAATISRVLTPPLLGHPSNFAPINAIALFSGCYVTTRWARYAIPLLAVWIGDLFINYIYLHDFVPFYDGFFWQYVCYVAIAMIGSYLSKTTSPLRVFSATIASSVLFFVISNFGVWVGSGMYPQTGLGLVACYTAAIPFFTATATSDLIYSALFFGSFQWSKNKFLNQPSISIPSFEESSKH